MTAHRSYAVALMSGTILVFAFPEPDVAPLAWVALAPVVALVTSSAPAGGWAGVRRGFGIGFVFGLAFFGALLHWVTLVGWAAWAVLIPGQALFIGAFGAVTALAVGRGSAPERIFVPAAAWVAFEYLRSVFPLGGFSWGELAQSQSGVGWLLPLASYGGGWAIAFVLVLVNSLVAEAFRALRGGRPSAAGALVVVAAGVIAAPALLSPPDAAGKTIEVAIVQGNVPRDFEGTFSQKELVILKSHEMLTKSLAGRAPDLVVWPESAVAIDPLRNPVAADALASAAQAVGTPMVVGGNLDVDAERYKVMTFQVSPEGEIVDSYQKTHLVPFGEYIPGRSLVGWLPILDQVPRDAVAGNRVRSFDVAGGSVATVISFEGDFGSLVRRPIARGGRMLVVATNTSTWGSTWASAQHVAFSKIRAVENGVWVVHAAISGISAFVSPNGDVVGSLGLWEAGTLVRDVRFAEDITFYARVGDWVPYVSLGLTAAWGALGLWRHPRGSTP